MSYTPTNWVNGSTPLNATNMNKIEQGIAAVDTGKQNKIPTITITDSQITESGITFAGDEYAGQRAIIENPNIELVYLELEEERELFMKSPWYNSTSEVVSYRLRLVPIALDEPNMGFFTDMLEYMISTKIANEKVFQLIPAEKTSSMTQSVGIDSDGTLWTTPGATSIATTASLAVAGWSNNSQTVSVTGVTASNNIIVAPAPASQSDYTAAGIICTAQGSGTLTFTCTTVPTAAITVNVLIVG